MENIRTYSYGSKTALKMSNNVLTNNSWLEINEDGSWHVFPSSSLAEEGVEGVITTSDGLVRGHLTIWLDTVLQTVQLPAGITDLASSLSNVD